ncbi:AraC family transcriptional regulator [marine bacterium AO1-C]|nr:AraC family transcriptional regulator [marine bacterium AO1-C]
MEDSHIIHIKNMVCARCIISVKDILTDLTIPFYKVELGEVALKKALTDNEQKQLNDRLLTVGFELLQSAKSALISRIKTLLINQIHHQDEPLAMNYSTFLTENLHQEYGYLSRLFSSVEGITIEKYIAEQKIEKVKELLFYNEFTLSEIAFQMHYSSTAHLSAQFKKQTGMTPTQFKKEKSLQRRSLDQI